MKRPIVRGFFCKGPNMVYSRSKHYIFEEYNPHDGSTLVKMRPKSLCYATFVLWSNLKNPMHDAVVA